MYNLFLIYYYLVFKENIHKLTAAASHIEDQEQNQNENKVKKKKLNNNPKQYFNDVTRTPTDFHFHETTNLGNLIYVF